MFKYLLAAATAWVILENIEEAITHGYIKVEYEERVTNNGEYDTIILRFDNKRLKEPGEFTNDVFYVPYKGNTLFMGRTLFKKTSRFDNTVKYDYDGYDELTDKEISSLVGVS